LTGRGARADGLHVARLVGGVLDWVKSTNLCRSVVVREAKCEQVDPHYIQFGCKDPCLALNLPVGDRISQLSVVK